MTTFRNTDYYRRMLSKMKSCETKKKTKETKAPAKPLKKYPDAVKSS